MKISLDNRLTYPTEAHGITRVPSSASVNATHKNFDAITINSDSRQINEKRFTELLSKNISDSVRHEDNGNRVETLKSKIQNNEYQMNYDILASRILLTQGGQNDA